MHYEVEELECSQIITSELPLPLPPPTADNSLVESWEKYCQTMNHQSRQLYNYLHRHRAHLLVHHLQSTNQEAFHHLLNTNLNSTSTWRNHRNHIQVYPDTTWIYIIVLPIIISLDIKTEPINVVITRCYNLYLKRTTSLPEYTKSTCITFLFFIFLLLSYVAWFNKHFFHWPSFHPA